MTESSNTKYMRVVRDLRMKIGEGVFDGDGCLPSENELCKLYAISVITARKALDVLAREGVAVRIRGRGTYLSCHAAAREPVQPGQGIVPMILLSYDPGDSSILSIIGGAQTHLSGLGYSMSIECGNEDASTEAAILDRCIRDRVKGVLLFSSDPEACTDKLAEMSGIGIPFVMLDRYTDAFPCTVVASYNFDGAYQMTRRLIENGHRRIAYMARDLLTTVHRERLSGYRAAMRQFGGDLREALCFTAKEANLELLVERVLSHGATAVVCLNDRLAIAVMDALGAHGLSVPGDVSVTGFDDSEVGRFANLTTVRQAFTEIGRLSAEKLIELAGGNVGHSRTFLPIEIIERGSTGPAKEGNAR